jgi:hypothetical protein
MRKGGSSWNLPRFVKFTEKVARRASRNLKKKCRFGPRVPRHGRRDFRPLPFAIAAMMR